MFYSLKRILRITLIVFIFITSTNLDFSFASNEDKKKIPNNNVYVLGPGDQLLVKVLSFEDFDSRINVLPDGTINLPRVGSIYISGLSVYDAQKKIISSFKKIIKDPIIYLDLLETRPVRISITGEVQKPGIYSIGKNDSIVLSNSDGGEKTTLSSKGFPRVIEAIQKAGGITNDGDLRKIELTRYNYLSKKIDKKIINYWLAFNQNEIAENPILFDGDQIYVPMALNKTNYELIKESSSNLAPSSITISVIGEVSKPGQVQVKANTSVTQSILIAGGFTKKAKKGRIFLIRLNNDGKIEKKNYDFSSSILLEKNQNIPVRDGDIIYVDRNNWTKSVDSLKTVVEPISPILNAASLYKILSN